ncbi:MAG: hypothetical protein K0R66_440 [Gammaproteobacteria bacterium]|jgi:hypothetical protein|nr:hypothetical protein [Gammaproteobacteria bacterium]
MKMTYYVVVPNLQEKGMSPAKCLVRALLQVNQEKLAEGIHFFADHENEARAYMQILPSKPEKSHCMLTLSIAHDAEPFLTTVNTVKRFYSINTQKVAPILPSCVSGIYIYQKEDLSLVGSEMAPSPRACTPIAHVSSVSTPASDPASVSQSSAFSQKGFREYSVLSDLPCFLGGDDVELESFF